MKKKLEEIYKLTDNLFPDIGKSCMDCNTCCKTYGWLLGQEAGEFSKKGYPVVEINKGLYCFDSFVKDKNNKRIIDRIPRCLFYKNGKCLVYKERPIDCRLYPIKVKFDQNRVIIGLSLGCKYVSSLRKKEKKKVYRNVAQFFKKAPQEIINDYLNLMQYIDFISKQKSFWMKKIMRMEKKEGLWKIIE